jgi:choice-of-anchor B domain-containing protein
MKKFLLVIGILFSFIMCSEDDDILLVEDPDDIQNEDPMDEPPPPPPPLLFPAPCEGGFAAGIYPCQGIDLIYHLDLDSMDASSGNDCWGWTDTSTGKEYAIIGLNNGTAFIDISNPSAPVYLGKLKTESANSTWRDVKVYKDHAFIVSEAASHGMQVLDLHKLRDINNPPTNFNADEVYNEFGSAHNIVINEESGYAYAVGTSLYDGGPHFINIQDPKNPQDAGGYSMGSYSHDAQVVTYNGPDTDYKGKEILIGSNASRIVLVDITDKNNPSAISSIAYDQVGYTHQGWFTENQRYFLVGDELDELNSGFNSRTVIFDFSDLDNPLEYFQYNGPTPAIDHNGYVKDNSFYLANYTAGLRIIDITGIADENMNEVRYFDSFPANNNASFDGAWSVFPYFESGHVIISDIDTGFYLVKSN